MSSKSAQLNAITNSAIPKELKARISESVNGHFAAITLDAQHKKRVAKAEKEQVALNTKFSTLIASMTTVHDNLIASFKRAVIDEDSDEAVAVAKPKVAKPKLVAAKAATSTDETPKVKKVTIKRVRKDEGEEADATKVVAKKPRVKKDEEEEDAPKVVVKKPRAKKVESEADAPKVAAKKPRAPKVVVESEPEDASEEEDELVTRSDAPVEVS